MTKYRAASIIIAVLLLLGLSTLSITRACAAPQPSDNPFYSARSVSQEPTDSPAASEVIEESPTPLARPINGKNGPSPLILCGIAAVVVAVMIAAVILRKARKFE